MRNASRSLPVMTSRRHFFPNYIRNHTKAILITSTNFYCTYRRRYSVRVMRLWQRCASHPFSYCSRHRWRTAPLLPPQQNQIRRGDSMLRNISVDWCDVFDNIYLKCSPSRQKHLWIKNNIAINDCLIICGIRGGSSLICKEGCRFSMGWCTREPYCPLSSAVCNAAIPTLPLFEMSESACLP